MTVIPDQRPVWDKKHGSGDHDTLRHIPSPLAELAEPYFPNSSYILELGCGVGRDAELFASRGHEVLATDGSQVVITQNIDTIPEEKIEFDVLDMREEFPYGPNTFDVVYANLSLHYYSDEQTIAIIREVARVLKPGGTFAFACKSYDSLHSDGKEIEKNVFASPSGATIHLFSTEYTRSLLDSVFNIKNLDEVEEEYNSRYSKIVRCIAAKR